MTGHFIVTEPFFPRLHAAFRLIEADNGACLIGTIYPGKRVDLERFIVPQAWTSLLQRADRALSALRAASEEDFETFVIGEISEQDAILARRPDLTSAHKLLNNFFDGWPPEDAPA